MTKKIRHSPGDPIVPDMDLWENIAQKVKPLRPRLPASRMQPSRAQSKPSPSFPDAAVVLRKPASTAEPPRLTGLDRRMAQRLLRGQVQYDSKLDLHGFGASEARLKLAGFLGAARSRGDRTVLVVTGKGASPFARHTLHGDSHYHSPERLGRLRRLVSEWLHEAEFREHVLGFQPAHPKHGGGGAYYIRLRRSGTTRR
jgi:DNA-nicking Smr family endonuclease